MLLYSHTIERQHVFLEKGGEVQYLMAKINALTQGTRLRNVLALVVVTAAAALLLQLVLIASSADSTQTATAATASDAGYNATAGGATAYGPSGSTAQTSSALMPMEGVDLNAASSLVVRGVASKEYREVLVQDAAGASAPVCFTERDFEILEVYRGETSSETITIRTKGGSKDDINEAAADGVTVWVEDESQETSFAAGYEYILYLYKPNFGGGWQTKDDYYLCVSDAQGVLSLGSDGLFYSRDHVNVVDPNSFAQEMTEINNTVPIDYDYHKNEMINALTSNYEAGIYNEELYQRELSLLEVYATVVG